MCSPVDCTAHHAPVLCGERVRPSLPASPPVSQPESAPGSTLVSVTSALSMAFSHCLQFFQFVKAAASVVKILLYTLKKCFFGINL